MKNLTTRQSEIFKFIKKEIELNGCLLYTSDAADDW